MRNRWFVLPVTLLASVLISARAEAASINISDLTDNNPVVVVAGLEAPSVSVLPEFAEISGLLRPATSQSPLTIGTTFLLLMEPPGDPFGGPVSDIIRLVASPIGQDAVGLFQTETVTFWSDGAAGFAAALAAAGANAPSILEIDGPQDITALLGINFPTMNLQVIVRSDVGGAEVPEPATLSLVALGLGVAAKRRFRS
jgi:PEP-CTERM motif